MPYRLEFKGEDGPFVRSPDPLFENTAKWNRAKTVFAISGQVSLRKDGKAVSADLSLTPAEAEPTDDQIFTAVWSDETLTLKNRDGKYIELDSQSQWVVNSAAIGPTSQFTVEPDAGCFRLRIKGSFMANGAERVEVTKENTAKCNYVIVAAK